MIPDEILHAYSLTLEEVVIKPIAIGLIHQTYKITEDSREYIFQSLNKFLSSPSITEDMDAVTKHLLEKGLVAPEVIKNKDNDLLTEFGDMVWRAQSYLGGSSYEIVGNEKVAYEAGKQLGIFHREMSDLQHAFKSGRPNHPTEEYLEIFTSHLDEHSDLAANIQDEVMYLQERVSGLLLPGTLPIKVIHGDPKISNFLFKEEKAFALIDLDTCSSASLLFDLGDAFRSWCGLEEDNPENTFNSNYFKSAIDGYFSEHTLDTQEVGFLMQSIKLITLELAIRFCNDYFADNYFGYNKKRYVTRRDHNLARMRGQIALHKSICEQEGEIKKVIHKFL